MEYPFDEPGKQGLNPMRLVAKREPENVRPCQIGAPRSNTPATSVALAPAGFIKAMRKRFSFEEV